MEGFVSKARSYAITKDIEAHVIMHEEMMDELREQTRLLKHLVKLEKLEVQAPAADLKVKNQKMTNAGTVDLKTEVKATFDK